MKKTLMHMLARSGPTVALIAFIAVWYVYARWVMAL